MYSFELNNIIQFSDIEELKSGCFLCVWYADKIPPHIGIVVDGLYFSLKVKGKDTAIPLEDSVKVIQRKKSCTVFIELKINVTIEEVQKSFLNYKNAEYLKSTCLTPIIEIFNRSETVKMLADLLNSFEKKKEIGRVFGLNLPPDFKGIRSYRQEDIDFRIKSLSKK